MEKSNIKDTAFCVYGLSIYQREFRFVIMRLENARSPP